MPTAEWLEQQFAALAAVRPWPPALLPALQQLLATAPNEQLAHLNPLAFAAAHALPENAVIDAWLHATRLGLLEMHWRLLCVWCGNLAESFRGLANMHGHFICRVCGTENQGYLDDTILASFQPHPQVRPTLFHAPEQLSAAALYQHYFLSPDVLPFGDGRCLAGVLAQLTRLHAYLPPGERLVFAVPATPGVLYLSDVAHASLLVLRVRPPNPAAPPQQVHIQIRNGKFLAVVPTAVPYRVPGKSPHPDSLFDQFGEITAGPTHFEIENHSDRRAALQLLQIDATYPSEALRFRPFLTGKRLFTSQTFRELFRTEIVADEENLAVHDLTFLFTDLKDSTALYETVGDPQAYLLVRQHFQLLTQIVINYHGAIVKTMGDALMATFATPADGLRAAQAMHRNITQFNHTTATQLILKVGLHNGPAIAVTQNERLDYFGQTVNIAARAQGLAHPHEIVLTAATYAAPGVPDLLAGWGVTPCESVVRGLAEPMWLYHVTLA